MTLRALLRLFEAADVARLPGLPPRLVVENLASFLRLDESATGNGFLGEERRRATWIAAESRTYEGGWRIWHDRGQVLVLEGRDPIDEIGEPQGAPALGEPEAELESMLGRLRLPRGERVYARRGVALRVNPDNELLLGLLAFVPTTVEAYVARLRPDLPPQLLIGESGSRGLL